MRKSRLNVSRRGFLKASAAASAAALAAPTIIPASALGRDGATAPSERITLGIVGLSSRGFNLIDAFLRYPDARIVSVCDVTPLHYRDQPWGKGPAFGRDPAKERIEKRYANSKSGTRASGLSVVDDYREVCEAEHVDAVVVATPDHWHALCTLRALRAGKGVYCEKPVTHTFHEGQLVCSEVAGRKAIFQTGSQQRSDHRFRHAVELVLNGHLGQIRRVEVGIPPGYDKPQDDPTPASPPKDLDYDAWSGPAPILPYMRARHHRWWRGHRAYGGGVLMDWIGHHNDIAHWALAMDHSGPQTVEAVGWTFPETDVYNTPHHYGMNCTYPGGVTSSISSRNPIGTKIIGDEGWLYVRRGRLEASDKRWAELDFNPGPKKAYRSNDHTANFLECIRSRQQCIAPAETGHRSITPGHLGYVSQALGRPLNWDAENEVVVGDEDANELLNRHSYREPWTLRG